MDKQIISKLQKIFEDYTKEADGVEFWYARDLQVLLGYTQWRNFLAIIDKAKDSCSNAGQIVINHFADVSKKVKNRRYYVHPICLLSHCPKWRSKKR